MGRVFVTGATGFLGSAVLAELTGAGFAVNALVRRPGALARDDDVAVREIPGDLADRSALRRGMDDVDAVLHVAAMVQDWVPARDRAAYESVNVDGLRNVLAAARDAGVGRVVYTSSFFALGPTDGCVGRVGDETLPLRQAPFAHPYEATKAAARRVFAAALDDGLPGIALYPTVIYGPGPLTEGNHITRLIDDFRRRRLPGIPGSGAQLWSFARVGDVARGHVHALERGRVGEGYLLGGDNVTLADFFAALEAATGVPAPRRHVPLALLVAVGRLQEGWAALSGRPPKLTSGGARLYRHHWAYSSEKARRELGYDPAPLEQGLAETLAWLDERERA